MKQKKVLVSDHGYDELAAEDILVTEILEGAYGAVMVEDYPDYPKRPCVLVLEKDLDGKPIHVVWGLPKGEISPAVVVTAYRPDPDLWSHDFVRRK